MGTKKRLNPISKKSVWWYRDRSWQVRPPGTQICGTVPCHLIPKPDRDAEQKN